MDHEQSKAEEILSPPQIKNLEFLEFPPYQPRIISIFYIVIALPTIATAIVVALLRS